jgi:magnesium chelatase family protein
VNYPADFILILAANPCPCGKYSGRGRACTCSSQQIRKYQQKLSGPLLDRIDIRTFVEVPSRIEMSSIEDGESSHVVRARVEQARAIAAERFKDEPWRLNSEIPAQFLRSKYKANRAGMAILHNELDKDRLSARGFHKVQRVAWSIADRVGKEIPGSDEVEYALTLRESASI